jgi:hypothetical protein
MAFIIPPQGHGPNSIVLTKDEALTVLATLSANATFANREVRRVLGEYLNRMPIADAD